MSTTVEVIPFTQLIAYTNDQGSRMAKKNIPQLEAVVNSHRDILTDTVICQAMTELNIPHLGELPHIFSLQTALENVVQAAESGESPATDGTTISGVEEFPTETQTATTTVETAVTPEPVVQTGTGLGTPLGTPLGQPLQKITQVKPETPAPALSQPLQQPKMTNKVSRETTMTMATQIAGQAQTKAVEETPTPPPPPDEDELLTEVLGQTDVVTEVLGQVTGQEVVTETKVETPTGTPTEPKTPEPEAKADGRRAPRSGKPTQDVNTVISRLLDELAAANKKIETLTKELEGTTTVKISAANLKRLEVLGIAFE